MQFAPCGLADTPWNIDLEPANNMLRISADAAWACMSPPLAMDLCQVSAQLRWPRAGQFGVTWQRLAELDALALRYQRLEDIAPIHQRHVAQIEFDNVDKGQ